GFCGRPTPSARDSEATEAAGALSETRAAGAISASETPATETVLPASAGRRSTEGAAAAVPPRFAAVPVFAAFVPAAALAPAACLPAGALAIEVLPLLVEEYHATDLHLDRAAEHRHM